MIENIPEIDISASADLSHLVCGSLEWSEFIDENGYDPTDVSEFRDEPTSPAVMAYAGVPAAVYAAPEKYDGPNKERVQAVLHGWRRQARRLVARPSATRPQRPRTFARTNLASSRRRSAAGGRRATSRASSSSGSDDLPRPRPPLEGGYRKTEPETHSGVFGWSGFGRARARR
jgi:hypothetical protein